MTYTETDLREAFKAGWKERNRQPGLKKVPRKDGPNSMLRALGGGRYAESDYVPDHKSYKHAIWTNSAFRRACVKCDGEKE